MKDKPHRKQARGAADKSASRDVERGAAAGKRQSKHSSGDKAERKPRPQQKKKPEAVDHSDAPDHDDAREAADAAWRKQRQQKRRDAAEFGRMHTTAPTKAVAAVQAQSRKGGRQRTKMSGEDLINSFKQRLAGGTFRMLNEQIYTAPSVVAGQLLRDRETYNQYHEGYRHQVTQWPTNPVDIVVAALKGDKRGRFVQHKSKHLQGHIPHGWVIADMGCGDAAISKAMRETNTVRSFDFCATNEHVTVADMANVPLEDEAADVVIFSLSLMSTNFVDFLYEAHRVCKANKLVKIVEVRSRMPDPERFAMLVESIGFRLDWWGIADGYFCLFDFVRLEGQPNRTPFSPDFDPCSLLTPCLYKRR